MTSPDERCIFCDILAGKLPASFVYHDDRCAAFMDIQPVNPGHLLIVPRRHSACLSELAEEDGARLFQIAQRLAAALRRSEVRVPPAGRADQGVNLLLADGEAAGQEVFHVHLHVFPRYDGDGFGFRFGPDYTRKPDRSELDRVANDLRMALAEPQPPKARK